MSKDTVISLKPLYLASAQAASFLSLSESMLIKLVAQGSLPKPRKLSTGRSAWLVEELEAWGKSLPVSDLLPPPGCGYGRAGKKARQAPDTTLS